MTVQERIHHQFASSLQTNQEALANGGELIELAAAKLAHSLLNDGKIPSGDRAIASGR